MILPNPEGPFRSTGMDHLLALIHGLHRISWGIIPGIFRNANWACGSGRNGPYFTAVSASRTGGKNQAGAPAGVKFSEPRFCDLQGNSKREQQILTLISEGKTSTQMAGELFLSSLTIETHRRNLLQKFDVKMSPSSS